MLVLTRKRTEQIRIGDDIVISVIHTSSGSVKLGIQAPSHVRVLRAELSERPVETVPVDSEDRDDCADSLSDSFDSEYVAALEDQALACLAR